MSLGPELLEHRPGLRAIGGRANVVAVGGEHRAHRLQIHRVVVDDQNGISTHKRYRSSRPRKV